MNNALDDLLTNFEGHLAVFGGCLESSITKSVQAAIQGEGVVADEDHDDSWLYDAICRCRENYLASIAHRNR